jgi:hypothetical protein
MSRRKLTEAELRHALRREQQKTSRLRQKLQRLQQPPKPLTVCVDEIPTGQRGLPRHRFIVGRDPGIRE